MAQTKEQYDKDISELEQQEKQIKQQIGNLKQLKAEMLCPYKIGDIIANKEGTRQAKLARITYGYGEYRMLGYWIKKDGSIDNQLRELYWFEWE